MSTIDLLLVFSRFVEHYVIIYKTQIKLTNNCEVTK